MTKGYRVARTEDLEPTLRRAIADDTVVVIDYPVDYSENMKLPDRSARRSNSMVYSPTALVLAGPILPR